MNKTTNHATLDRYAIAKTDNIAAEKVPSTANNKSIGNIYNKIGNPITKNNSSKNNDIIVMAVLFPNFTPSLCINNISKVEPPAADGVIAEVNSYNILILNKEWNDNCFSDKRYKRPIPDKSRIATANKAKNKNNTVYPFKYFSNGISASFISLNSEQNIHTIPANPNRIGRIICDGFNRFETDASVV